MSLAARLRACSEESLEFLPRNQTETLPIHDKIDRHQFALEDPARRRPWRKLEANVAYDVSAFVLDHIGTFRALKGGLGVFVTERRGFFIIRLGGVCILRSTSSTLRKSAHSL